MSDLLNPGLELLEIALEDSPEVKSYVYQQIAEFQPYVTPQTIVAVILKDPTKLALQYEAEGKEFEMKDLKSLYRISISLKEGKAKITAEGVDKDIFVAIRIAKDILLKKLVAIQDSVVTQQERNMEIHHALQNTMIH
jgi:ribosome-associated translation inhibitor RaiA